jgi:hypothetical protein
MSGSEAPARSRLEVENEVRWESVRSGYPLFEEAVGGGIGVVPADKRRPGPRTEDRQGGVVGARASWGRSPRRECCTSKLLRVSRNLYHTTVPVDRWDARWGSGAC